MRLFRPSPHSRPGPALMNIDKIRREAKAKKQLAGGGGSAAPDQQRRERPLFTWRSGAAIAGAALAGAALYNHLAARRAEADNPPIGKFVEIDGLPLHLVDCGSGPAILLIHGNGAMVGDWEA